MHSFTHTFNQLSFHFFFLPKCCLTFLFHICIGISFKHQAVSDLKEVSCATAAAVVLKTAKTGKKAKFPDFVVILT